MQCTRLPALPRRMCGTPTKSGILLGSDPQHVKAAREWASQVTQVRPNWVELVDADDVVAVVSELVTNALEHTASGLPNGTVLVEIEHTDLHLVVSVTDNGPRPGQPHSSPDIPPLCLDRPGGNGLRLVESIATSWAWTQAPTGRTTVNARFRRRLPAPLPAGQHLQKR